MNTMNHETAVQNVSDISSLIAASAGVMIDCAIASGRRLPVTKLSQDIATKLGFDKVLCYHIISKYISVRGDLRIKMGPNGGIERKPTQ